MPTRRRKPDTYRRLLARAAVARAGPPGYGMGTAWGGGTLYADAFGAKRGPTPAQLIEGFKQISFAAEQVIVGAMSRLALRLYSASGPGRPKPRSYAEPRTVSRSEMKRLNSLGYLRRSLGGAEDAHEIMSYPLIDTLNKPCVDPETEMSYFDRPSWMGTLVRYVDICGWGWVKPENENGVGLAELVAAAIPPDRLWPLQSQYVWGERETNSAFIKRVKYFNEYYQPNDLLMFRLIPSPRDPYGAGYAPLQAAWQYCQLEDKSISMWDQLLGSGARPNLLISPEDPSIAPGDDERKRFEAELNTYHARGRAGRSLVTTGGWKFTPLNYQGFDLGEMEVNIYLKEMICHCLGVPLSFLSKETNIANLQASRTQLAEQAVEPRAQMLASVLTDLVRKYDDRLFFAFDESIPEDEERKAKIKSSQVKDGIITWNEARLDTPFEPRPDGDQVWVSNSLATTDMLAEKHESGLKTAEMTAQAKANPPAGPPAAAKKEPSGERSALAGMPDLADADQRRVLRRAERVLKRLERELKR